MGTLETSNWMFDWEKPDGAESLLLKVTRSLSRITKEIILSSAVASTFEIERVLLWWQESVVREVPPEQMEEASMAQWVLQPSRFSIFPSSHASPGSLTPFPHNWHSPSALISLHSHWFPFTNSAREQSKWTQKYRRSREQSRSRRSGWRSRSLD